MPFSITVHRVFSAAHAVRLPDGTLETLHGHDWNLQVTITRIDGGLDRFGFVCDFHDLQHQLDTLLKPLHNNNLNQLPEIADLNPTAENVCFHIARKLKLPPDTRLESVQVTEAQGCLATYRPPHP